MRRPGEAAEAFRKVAELEPRSGPAYHNLGLALRLSERVYDAIDAFRQAVQFAPDHVDSYVQLYQQYQLVSAWGDAVEALEQGILRHPKSVSLILALAHAYGQTRNVDKAEQHFQRAVQLDPAAGQTYGVWLQEEGRFEEAAARLTESIKLQPVQGLGYFGLAEAKRFKVEGASLLKMIGAVEKQPALDAKGRMFLHYAKAKAYDHDGDYRAAMESYDLANEAAFRIFNAGRPFDHAVVREHTDKLVARYAAARIEELRTGGSPSEAPVFIVGMIRSGTTLLDQIVSSHPSVKSAGELQYWKLEAERLHAKPDSSAGTSEFRRLGDNYLMVLRTVAEDSTRITDKMPLNYEHLGLIHATFPKARILHIRRNPLDTCLSIYATFYGGGPNFAYSRKNIVCFYKEYLRFMEHWRRVLPTDRFLEIDYEALVGDSEPAVRKIIEFCGLPWNDSCLHHEENRAAVSTPSRWQARQPIYKTSVERWRRYEPWLGDFAELKEVAHPPLSYQFGIRT